MVGWMPQPVILVSVVFLSWAACGSGGAERERERGEYSCMSLKKSEG